VTTAEKYVAAAYAVFLLALLVYVAIISLKLARLEREIGELAVLARARMSSEEGVRSG
jgi:hypothetical protein